LKQKHKAFGETILKIISLVPGKLWQQKILFFPCWKLRYLDEGDEYLARTQKYPRFCKPT
jgi:hypothetical protein